MSRDGDFLPGIGHLLRRARRKAGLTQKELAGLAGLSAGGISDLERGITLKPRQQTLDSLCDALGLTEDERRAWRRAALRLGGRDVARHQGMIPPTAPPRLLEWGRDPDQIVGRDAELDALRHALERGIGHAGTVVQLAGEPGIGKTSLARHLAVDATAQGAAVHWGSCTEVPAAPAYWPWTQMLRAWIAQRDEESLAEDLGADAAALSQIVPQIRERLPGIPEPPVAVSDAARFRLFDAVALWLRRSTRRRPIVLVIDDLHLADTASLRLLQFVAGQLHTMRVLLLVTYRDMALYTRPALSETLADLSRQPGHLFLQLRGWDERDVGLAIEKMAGIRPSDELVTTIHQLTDGNPFFVTEVARVLAAGDLQSQSPDARGLETIPGSVRETIRTRVGALSPACQSLLDVVAVIGRGVTVSTLAAVVGQPMDEVIDLLEEAAAARIVDLLADAREVLFTHGLIREALYSNLGATTRIGLHARVAETLAGVHRDDGAPPYGDIARHYRMAASRGFVEPAVDYSIRAAEQAMRQAAWESAVDHYRAALRLLDAAPQPNARRRCEVLLACGDVQNVLGGLVGSADARETFASAAELARQLAAPDLFARAAVGYAGLNILRVAGGEQQLDLLEEALQMLGDDASVLGVQVRACLATTLSRRSLGARRDLSRARSIADEALAMARRVGEPGVVLYVLIRWLVAQDDPDLIRERLAVADEAIAVASAIGDREMIAWSHDLRCNDLIELGDIDAAEQSAQVVRHAAATLRLPGLEWSVLNRAVVRQLNAGDYAAAEVTIDQLEARDPLFAPLLQRFLLRREQGRLGEIDDALRSRFGSSGGLFEGAIFLILDLEVGRLDVARGRFEAVAPARYLDLPRDAFWLITLALHAEVCYALGDALRARVMLSLLEPHAGRVAGITGNLYLGSMARFLGLLATTCAAWDAADRYLHDAVSQNRRLAMPPFVAHSWYALAEMRARRGEPTDRELAKVALVAAMDTARPLGMRSLLERSVDLAGRLGRDEPLVTPRERDILRLLADGRSNQEIAVALSISPTTVATHVTNILNKLGLQSRSAAAAWAVRHGVA